MQSIPVSKSLEGIRGSCFNIRLEYNEDFIIVHFSKLDKITKEVFLEMKDLLDNWWVFWKTVGYQAVFAAVEPDSKINKLLHMLKFEYIGKDNEYFVYRFKE
jgi:hypothetical protein|tara:strand:- start:197 stop:502 length:306 start_codon:yes stop_codon:yes gene_type:complete